MFLVFNSKILTYISIDNSTNNRTKVDEKDRQKIEQEQFSITKQISVNYHGKSSSSNFENVTDIIEMTNDGPNTQYTTNVIVFQEQYATSIMIPDRIFSIINEQFFPIVQSQLSQEQFAILPNLIADSNNQMILQQNNENIVFKSSENVHRNYFNEDKQSIDDHNKSLFITERNSLPSDNQLQTYENNTAFIWRNSSSQTRVDHDYEKKKSSIVALENIAVHFSISF